MKTHLAVRRGLMVMLESPTAVAAVVVLHVLLLVRAAWSLSPTIDEPGHLASGISYWRQGHVKLYRVNPPLVRMIAALPAMAAGAQAEPEKWDQYETTRPEFPAGTDLLLSNGRQSLHLFSLARMPVIGFSVFGALCCGAWARDMFGPIARFFAVTVWCSHPLVLGHGAMITADVAAAATGVFTAYLFARWLRQPLWAHATAWGFALGISLCVKSLWCLLGPFWLMCWGCFRLVVRRQRIGRELLQLLLGGCLSFIVVNSVYLWSDVGRPLGELDFRSHFLTGRETVTSLSEPTSNRFRGTLVGKLPVPIAADYLEGMDLQRVDFERAYSTWILGKKRMGPVHEFYPVALILKTPLGMIASALLALLFPPKLPLADGIVLFGISASVAATLGLHATVNHVRYALPLLPFAAIWIGGAGSGLLRHHFGVFAGFSGCLAAGAASSILVSPWHLSYLNELVRPGRQAALCFVDSQTDWGQGLLALRDWLDAHPEVDRLKMAYYGTVPPSLAGIEFELPPAWPVSEALLNVAAKSGSVIGPDEGWYAISGSLLVGADGRVIAPDGRRIDIQSPCFRWLLQAEPAAVVGGSIFLFHITAAEAHHIRLQFGLVALAKSTDAGERE